MEHIYLENQILNKYKTKIFRELVKLVWEESLDDIEKIPTQILRQLKDDTNQEIDEDTIMNLIRVIMGLNPIENSRETNLQSMINESYNLKNIDMPIISIIDDACRYCKNYKEECFVKKKHIDCNKNNTCSACGECIRKCELGAISDKIEFFPVLNMLKSKKTPVYAVVAPAFVGQFGKDASSGKLRTALKSIGFKDMIEVALAADILTLKESYDYYEHMRNNSNEFFITSCCCPVWVSLIKNKFPDIKDNISSSVSPMIASGRIIKVLNPNAKVVFIGPCVAKKNEALQDDVKGAIDFVLTFKELEEIFLALNLDVLHMEEDNRDESSYCGRIYAKSGGVSKAIEETLKKIDESIKFKPISFQGAKECTDGLNKIINKEINATFIEGMGCIGGCIGGPKKLIPTEEGVKYLDIYTESTNMKTPFDNLNVAQFLIEAEIKKIEDLGDKNNEMIQRIFSKNLKE
ncbi:MAG: [Fe-Fe] hydrogenase large subunit C-terminal domain-containing protein [Peptostreptococcaceae bacterium]